MAIRKSIKAWWELDKDPGKPSYMTLTRWSREAIEITEEHQIHPRLMIFTHEEYLHIRKWGPAHKKYWGRWADKATVHG